MLKLSIALLTTLTLAACATGSNSGYSQRVAQLTADCEARGGRLAPSIGVGRRAAPLNYQCDMAGGGGRLASR